MRNEKTQTEEPRHRKRKTKKRVEKSDHRHEYAAKSEENLVLWGTIHGRDDVVLCSLQKSCVVCGKEKTSYLEQMDKADFEKLKEKLRNKKEPH